jgi:hypothetical protein
MKKLLFKVAVLVGIMLMVPYYLLDGGMPGFLKGLVPGSSGKDKPLMNMSNAVTDQDVKLYKWVDEKGVTHFSDSDPMNVQAEEQHLKPDTNLMKAVRPQGEEEAEGSGGSVISLGGDKDKKDGEPTLGNPYSPEAVQKLVKDAQNVAKMMEQRNQELDKIQGNAP